MNKRDVMERLPQPLFQIKIILEVKIKPSTPTRVQVETHEDSTCLWEGGSECGKRSRFLKAGKSVKWMARQLQTTIQGFFCDPPDCHLQMPFTTTLVGARTEGAKMGKTLCWKSGIWNLFRILHKLPLLPFHL